MSRKYDFVVIRISNDFGKTLHRAYSIDSAIEWAHHALQNGETAEFFTHQPGTGDTCRVLDGILKFGELDLRTRRDALMTMTFKNMDAISFIE